MHYIKYTISVSSEEASDILVAYLLDFGFDSFTSYDETLSSIEAYIPVLEERNEDISSYLTKHNISYNREAMEDRNWNLEWESSFSPIEVGSKCIIRASFHASSNKEYDIIITPKMSFGTGHHATTHLMCEMLLEVDFISEQGLDVGSGTGILSILSIKRGALTVDALDIDEWAYVNCIENISLNKVESSICPILGDISSVRDVKYDFILANINRNILLKDIPNYVNLLREKGTVIVSGILETDYNDIVTKATDCGLILDTKLSRDGWLALKFSL